jgi:hypothetical protein
VGTAIFKEINDPAVTAFAIGFANMVTYMAVSAIASMAGPVMDAFAGGAQKVGQVTVYPAQAYGAIFAIVAGLSVISLLAALKMPETRGVQYRPAEDI